MCLDHVSSLVELETLDTLHFSPINVNGGLNDGVGVVLGHAVMGEQGVQEGTKHAPLRGPSVEDQRGRCVVAYITTWGRPVRKSRIQLQREVFSPRVLSSGKHFVTSADVKRAL